MKELSDSRYETFEKRDNFCHRMKDNGLFWSDWWKGAGKTSPGALEL